MASFSFPLLLPFDPLEDGVMIVFFVKNLLFATVLLYSSESVYLMSMFLKGHAQALATASLGCVACGAEQKDVFGSDSLGISTNEDDMLRDPGPRSEQDGGLILFGKSGDHRAMGSVLKDCDLGTI